MIVSSHEKVEWSEVNVLEQSERGAGGFGHTGKKLVIFKTHQCLMLK